MYEEVSLRELIDIILKGRKLIAGVTIAFILIAAVINFFILDPVYQAKAVLSVNQTIQQNTETEGLEKIVNNLTEMPQANAQSYASQAKTSAVLQSTMERVGIDPQTVPVSVFANKIDITNLKGTDLLEFTVKDKDPKAAAEIANTLSEVFVDFISNTSKNRIEKTIIFLETQVSEEQVKVDQNVKGMKEFLQQSPSVTQLEKELEASLKILASLRTDLVEYEIKANGLRAAIVASEKELATIADKVQLKKSLFDDPVLFQVEAGKNNQSVLTASELELLTEEINPTYVTLKDKISLNKNKLALYEQQKDSAEGLINTTVERIENIQVDLAEKKTKYTQMEAELKSTIENYDLFKNKYAETKISQSIEAGEAAMVIVSPAHEPVLPTGPRKLLNTSAAAIAGLILGVFVVVFRNYMVNTNTIHG